MNDMIKNEKGLTLVELLATLVLMSLFSGIIMSMILHSMRYKEMEITKTDLQQEANYVIAELQRIHRLGDTYTLTIEENSIKVKTDTEQIISDRYYYDVDGDFDEAIIDPTKKNVYLNEFTIKSKTNENLKVEISTVISRYKHN